MKKGFIMLCLFVSLLAALNTYAQEKETDNESQKPVASSNEVQYNQSPLDKLSRGLTNTVTCWAEIPAGIAKVSREEEPVKGCILGTFGGVFSTALRAFTGIYDTVTFFVPPYNRPLMQPEYALGALDQETKVALW